jgi:hypothetical protein
LPAAKRDNQASDTPAAFAISFAFNDDGAAASSTRVRSSSDVG